MEATEGPLSKTAPESGAEPPSPIPGRHTLTNAPGTHSCQPAFIYAPSTLDEIQLVVRAAGEAGRHVRVAGGLRSHGDAAMTKDVVVSLERYGRVHMIDCDKAIIMVQAGVTMGRLHDKLASFELALPQFGSDPDVTLAGALSMGEGASTPHLGGLANCVRELQMVLSSGQVVIASKRRNPELFRAALCGLGCLGIITGVVLQCGPVTHLAMTTRSTTLADVMARGSAVADDSDFTTLEWVPVADTVRVTRWRRCRPETAAGAADAAAPPSLAIAAWVLSWYAWARSVVDPWVTLALDVWLAQWVKHALLFASIFVPAIMPLAARLFAWTLYAVPRTATGRADVVLRRKPSSIRVTEASWAVAAELLPEALAVMAEIFAGSPVDASAHFPVTVEFARADDVWLSPAFGRDVAVISVPTFRPLGAKPSHASLDNAVSDAMLSLGARPRWGCALPVGAARLRPLYPRWDHFAEMRSMLDPEGMFVNAWLHRHLVHDGAIPAGAAGAGRSAASEPVLAAAAAGASALGGSNGLSAGPTTPARPHLRSRMAMGDEDDPVEASPQPWGGAGPARTS